MNALPRDLLRSLREVFGPLADADRTDNLDQGIAPLVVPLYDMVRRYFRAKVVGLDKMPAGRALVVGNHNAGITFLEPVILGLEWHRRNGGGDDLHFLAHDAMVALPVLGNLLMKCGAVRASREAAGRILGADRKMVVFPGGNLEAFRPWTERHRVDFQGRTGFARVAVQQGAPIVPLLCDGGHDTFCVLWQGRALARLTRLDKLLRSGSFPLFLGLPWGIALGPIFHLPLPVKMHIELGEPVPTDHIPPEKADDPETLKALAGQVQAAVQAMMDRRHA